MTVTLPPELEQYVSEKVASGTYASASDVIRDGLELLRKWEEPYEQRLEELRREIALGIAQADAGMLAPLDAQAILARVRARRAESRKDN